MELICVNIPIVFIVVFLIAAVWVSYSSGYESAVVDIEEKDKITIRPGKEVLQILNPSVIMVVVYIKDEKADCVWNNNFGVQRGYFPLNSLELYIKPQA